MNTIDEVWSHVGKKAAKPLLPLIPALRKFLDEHDNPLSKVLAGRALVDDAELSSEHARHLELSVISLYRNGQLAKREAGDWLELISAAIRRSEEFGITLPVTRVVAFPPPASSPFVQERMQQENQAELWRMGFMSWLRISAEETDSDEWVAALVLSCVLFGALVDKAKILLLLFRINGRLVIANRRAYLEFAMPCGGMGNLHLQRWFPDPVTELLWARKPSDLPILTEKSVIKAISRILARPGIEVSPPKSLSDLINAGSIFWETEGAQVDIHSMRRTFLSHSIRSSVWVRLNGCLQTERPRAELPPFIGFGNREVLGQMTANAQRREAEWLSEHHWFHEALSQIQDGELQENYCRISELAESCVQPGAAAYLEWLKFMLAGNGSTGRPRKLSTVRAMFVSATPRLLGMIGVEDPREWEAEELFEVYRELAAEDGADRPFHLSRALREFHHFLHKTAGLSPLLNVEEIIGEEAGLAPVDATLISSDDYQKALDWLNEQRLIGVDGDLIAVCRIVLMMAFRLGMRRMEIIGLRLKDLHLKLGMDCLVRAHAGRRLKTSNSRRRLPISLLFNWKDRKELRSWYERRLAEEARDAFSAYFLAIPKAGRIRAPVESITEWIKSAVHAVTGDTRFHLHHCRHAFATWLYLKLRSPDYPEVAETFSHLPITCAEFRNARRLRYALLGVGNAPSRTYAFAVARLLGHSSPAVSMSHYIHGNDLLLHAITCRSAKQLSKRNLAAVAGVDEQCAYKLLANGIENLLEWSRGFNPQNFECLLPNEPNAQIVRGRPIKPTGANSPDWLDADRVWAVLHWSANLNKTAGEIAKELGFTESKVTMAIEMGKQFAPKLISGYDSNNSFCPVKPRIAAEIEWSHEFEDRIAQLAQKNPALCQQGLSLFLQNFNRQRRDVVFSYPRQINEAKLYLRFLNKLGFNTSDLCFVLRGEEIAETDWGLWQSELAGLSDCHPSLIKRPSKDKASYAHWLGIKVLGSDKYSWPAVTASTILLARIGIAMGEA